MTKSWTFLSKEELYKDHWKTVEKWNIENPKGFVGNFTIVTGMDVVVVFSITADDQVLVLKEYFFSIQDKVRTMVAGMLENGDAKSMAIQELREEAGCVAKEMIHLGSMIHGKYTRGEIHCFLAKDIEVVGEQQLEVNEDIEVEFVPLSEFRELLKTGKITSVPQVACAYMALDYLNKL